jgi:hypothetical protein
MHSIFRTITRLRRNVRLVLPALALAVTLGTVVVLPPPAATNAKVSVGDRPIYTPQVNWNS